MTKTIAAVGLVLVGAAALAFSGMGRDDLPAVHVYKSPTCGCCTKWIEHLEDEGFEVTVEDVASVAEVKQRYGVPGDLASCHTALIGDYVVEGHVPARVIKSFLSAGPELAGLAVPGMPVGSPGMEGPNPEPYDVVAFDEAGNRGVFERISP